MNDLTRWLQILFLGFTRKPPSPEDIAFYQIGLGDLPPEKLDLAFRETIRRHPTDFRPMPGQIRGYMESALVDAPARASDADPFCPQCNGTGWAIISGIDGLRYAGICDCVKLARTARAEKKGA